MNDERHQSMWMGTAARLYVVFQGHCLSLLVNICMFAHAEYKISVYIINPRRACAEGYSSRLVCMYVYHAHAILAVYAIKSVTKDTLVLNVRFAAIL